MSVEFTEPSIETPRADCRLVVASGEIDAHTAPRLRTQIRTALAESEVRQLVIDLSGATFLDSSALGVLIGALKLTGEREGRLDIVAPPFPVRRIFEITSLDRVLSLHDTRASALASAAG